MLPKGAVPKARTLLSDTVPFVDLTPIYTTAITMEIDNLDLAISLVSLRSRGGKCRGPGRRYIGLTVSLAAGRLWLRIIILTHITRHIILKLIFMLGL